MGFHAFVYAFICSVRFCDAIIVKIISFPNLPLS